MTTERKRDDTEFKAAIAEFDRVYGSLSLDQFPSPSDALELIASQEKLDNIAKRSALLAAGKIKKSVIALQESLDDETATKIITCSTTILQSLNDPTVDLSLPLATLNRTAERLIQEPAIDYRWLGYNIATFGIFVVGALAIGIGVGSLVANPLLGIFLIVAGAGCVISGLYRLAKTLKQKSPSEKEKKLFDLKKKIMRITTEGKNIPHSQVRSIAAHSFLAANSPSLSTISDEKKTPPPSPPAASSSASSSITESKQKASSPFLTETENDVEIYFSPEFFVACCPYLEGYENKFENPLYGASLLEACITYGEEAISSVINNSDILDDLFRTRLGGATEECNLLGTDYHENKEELHSFENPSEEAKKKQLDDSKLVHYITVIQKEIPGTTQHEACALLAARGAVEAARMQGGGINSGALLLAQYLKPLNFGGQLLSEAKVSKQADGSFIIESILKPDKGTIVDATSGEMIEISNPIKYHETYHLKQNKDNEWALILQPRNCLYVNRELWKPMLAAANEALSKKRVGHRELFTIIPCLNDKSIATRFETAVEMRADKMPEREEIKKLISACYGEQWPAHLEKLKSLLDASVEETPAPRSSRSGSLSRGAAS